MPAPVSTSHGLRIRLDCASVVAALTIACDGGTGEAARSRLEVGSTSASPREASNPRRYTTTHSEAPRAIKRPCTRVPRPKPERQRATLATRFIEARIAPSSISGVSTLASTVVASKSVIEWDRMREATATSSGTLAFEPTTSARSWAKPCAPRAIAPTKARAVADGDAARKPATNAMTATRTTVTETGKA
eukprot:6198707-Pleurochrysis_carterae.AAC.1